MPLHHYGTEELSSERILLRRFRLDDAQAMYDNWASDPEVTRHLTWRPHGSVEDTRQIIEIWHKEYEKINYYQWGIVYRPENELIGSISLMDVREISEHCEVGYCIARPYWGRGVMTEALRLVVAFAFDKIGFKRVAAFHSVDNPASGRVMAKVGMQYEGTLRNYMYNSLDQLTDCKLWSIIPSDTRL